MAAAWDALRARPLPLLLLASAALKLYYVFGLTAYPSYLFSDFGAYWTRALERAAGPQFDYAQWAYWPPVPHILLAWYLNTVRQLGLDPWQLEAALVANVAASTACVALVYGIARETLGRRALALAVAALYAFTFPLVYFNAFVMSEHGAALFMLAALWLIVRHRQLPWALLAAGAALGLAAALRPALGLFGLPCFLYLALAERLPARAALLRGALFSLGFFMVVAAAVGETSRISRGAVVGLAANGGQNFYFTQCRVSTVTSNYYGGVYSFTAVSHSERPEYGHVYVDVPMYDQAFFYRLGWRCLREEPHPLSVAAQRAGDLFFGPLLPTVRNAAGFPALFSPFRWLLLACVLLAPLALAGRPALGVDPPKVRLLAGILAAAAVTFALFGAEHRYLYPLVPLLYVLAACALLVAVDEPRRLALAGAAWALALGLPVVVAAAAEALRWRGVEPPIAIEIRRFAPGYLASGVEPRIATLEVRRLRFAPGERLASPAPEQETFAVHRTCMEVRNAGLYELQVLPNAGFALLIDGRPVLANASAGPGEIYRWRLPLAQGKHPYAVRMARALPVTATWRRVRSRFSDFAPALDMRYVGEPGEDAVFLPPERC